jgi:hypothetical protein
MARSALTELNLYHAGIVTANEDIYNGNLTTDVVSLANYGGAVFFIVEGAGGTGTAVITIESCDDTTPTTSTAVAFNYSVCTSGNTIGSITAATSSGFTTTAGTNQSYMMEIRADELSGTHKYVRMVATESANDPVDGAAGVILVHPKYPADPPREAIT